MKTKINKKQKLSGLYLRCNSCGKENSTILPCNHNNTVFKLVKRIKGVNDGKLCKKVLKATNYEEAVVEYYLTIKEFKEQPTKLKEIALPQLKEHTETLGYKIKQAVTLNDCVWLYLNYLQDDFITGEFEVNNNSKNHIEYVKKQFVLFEDFLTSRNYHYLNIKFIDLNRLDHTALFYSYLKSEKVVQKGKRKGQLGLDPLTYKKTFNVLSSFYIWVAKQKEINKVNPFIFKTNEGSGKRKNPILSPDEFFKLIAQVTPQNGMCPYTYKRKNKKGVEVIRQGKLNLYRDWLQDALMLYLFTGRRREEVLKLRWNMINYDDKGNMFYISIENYKVNRLKNITFDRDKQRVEIPIHEKLEQLLYKMGYNEYKDTDNYIIAPGENLNRGITGQNFMTKAFTHFYSYVNRNIEKKLGCLRKTNFSYLVKIYGLEKAVRFTDHSSVGILLKWYTNHTALLDARNEIKILPEQIAV